MTFVPKQITGLPRASKQTPERELNDANGGEPWRRELARQVGNLNRHPKWILTPSKSPRQVTQMSQILDKQKVGTRQAAKEQPSRSDGSLSGNSCLVFLARVSWWLLVQFLDSPNRSDLPAGLPDSFGGPITR